MYNNDHNKDEEEEKTGPILSFVGFLTDFRFYVALISIIIILVSKCS